jgi:hypothetical protein
VAPYGPGSERRDLRPRGPIFCLCLMDVFLTPAGRPAGPRSSEVPPGLFLGKLDREIGVAVKVAGMVSVQPPMGSGRSPEPIFGVVLGYFGVERPPPSEE